MARSPQPEVVAGTLASTLSSFRYGAPDLTTRLSPGQFWRATLTPRGPGTLHLDWRDGTLRSEAWGDGADWLLQQVPAMTGALDPGHEFVGAHPVVMRAQHFHPDVRFGASGTLYHELLPTVLGQRVTAGEALIQWRRLVDKLGAPAPGPATDEVRALRLPPVPEQLADRPAWWFHPLGIEAKRAEPLRLIGRHAARIAEWSALPAPEAAAKLHLLRGIGAWTTGSALAVALGDPDSVAVGDFHLKNAIVHAFTGRPRGTDDEMLELLAPYAGQRGRVVRLLLLDGHAAPKFGPRQRVVNMTRW